VAQQEVPVSGDGENALEWSEGYNKDKLQEVADAAGIEVKGTGADGAVLKEDLVKALRKETKKARETK
jgi:predicted metallo-beta-lactamase superfamily hydrolase